MKARPPSAVKGTPRRAMSRKGSSLDMMGLSASRYSIGGGGSLKLGAGSGLDSGGWGFVNAVNGLAANSLTAEPQRAQRLRREDEFTAETSAKENSGLSRTV